MCNKIELQARLVELKEKRALVRKDWDILNKKDGQSYANWNNEQVFNTRTKEEGKQFNALSKQLSALNSEIRGVQRTLLDLLQLELKSLYE